MTGGSFCPATAARLRFENALIAELEKLAGGRGLRVAHTQTAWASLTFAGTRHQLLWTFDGAEDVDFGHQMAALLPEHEFTIPDALVADATVVSKHWRINQPRLELLIEILVLEQD